LKADLALINGKIVTMDPEESIVEAVAVKYGRLVKVGKNRDVKSLVGDGTKVIDLKGRTVVPGLIDSHCHMMSVGASRKLNVDLSEEAGVHSIADLVDRLRERAEKTPKGGWVLGYQEDDSKLAEKRHPTRWELDRASTEHPIILSTVGGHFSVANSYAFKQAGATKDTPDPVGGRFDRDATGEMTGGLHEKAIDMVLPESTSQPTREMAREGAREILQECASVGLTCVYDTVERSQMRAALDLKNIGGLPIRVRMDIMIDLFPELNKLGIYRGLGDDWLGIRGLKFFFDGAISARTAAVTEEYLNKPGFYGVMATTR
jgi:predicted amidohydrolase YtcJ